MRGGAPLTVGMRRRCHHLIGDPVRFLFVDIPRLVDLEFGLQTQSLLLAALRALAARHRVIAAGALALEQATAHRVRGWLLLLCLVRNLAVHLPIPPYTAPATCSPSRVGLPSCQLNTGGPHGV